MLTHGGRLLLAAREENIPVDQWLDLSTGISPFAYRHPPVPASYWHRLPEDEDGLLDAAAAYFGTEVGNILPVAGSQAAIQAIPRMLKTGLVAMLSPSYNEHAHAWQSSGHSVTPFATADELKDNVHKFQYAVICNPNNPTGETWDVPSLQEMAKQLQTNNGLLLVDEAFIDSTPELSITPLLRETKIAVLRSLGKFFGLAGARVGFLLTKSDLLYQTREFLGPWTLSGPSRYVASQCLQDFAWQKEQRERLANSSNNLHKILNCHGIQIIGNTNYFQYVHHHEAKSLYQALRRHAILVRLFPETMGLRFGLPANPDQLNRLSCALDVECPRLLSSPQFST